MAVRYGETCDGLVCQSDAVLPHSARVLLDNMDHFGPAGGGFPATDPYDPTRLWLVCISMALRFGTKGTAPDPTVAPNCACASATSAPPVPQAARP